MSASPTMDVSFLNSVIGSVPYAGFAPVSASRVNPISGKQEEEEKVAGRDSAKDARPFGLGTGDSASISSDALQALAREQGAQNEQGTTSDSPSSNGTPQLRRAEEEAAQTSPAGQEQLSAEEQQQVNELRARDTEVRAHEAAHAAAAGSLARGGPSYDYQRGPDGVSYAVGGEVPISVGSGSTPEEKIANAEQAQRAATAPANPSGADQAVAASAAQVAASARAELAEEEATEETSSEAPGEATLPANGTPESEQLPGKLSLEAAEEAEQMEQTTQAEQTAQRSEPTIEFRRRAQAYADVAGLAA